MRVVSSEQLAKRVIAHEREKALCDRIESSMDVFCHVAELPTPNRIHREYGFGPSPRRKYCRARADFLIVHEDSSKTIVEAKRVSTFHDIAEVLAQLMLYEALLGEPCNLVGVVDGAFHEVIVLACEKYGVPIKWVLADEDGMDLLEWELVDVCPEG